MRSLRVSCISAILGAVFFSQSAIAGGDLYIPAPQKKTSWSGLYVGGGFGFQQLRADTDIDSKLHSESKDVHGCYTDDTKTKKHRYTGGSNTMFINNGTDQDGKYAFALLLLKCQYQKNTVDTNPKYKHFNSDLNFTHNETYTGDWNGFGTLMVGYDHQLNDKLVVGIFGSLDLGSADLSFTHTHTSTPVGTYYTGTKSFTPENESATITGNIKIENSFTIAGRFGHLFNNNKTLGYFLAGYTHAKAKGNLNMTTTGDPLNFIKGTGHGQKSYRYVPTNASSSFSETLNGVTVGAGAEHKFNNNWSLRLEYRYTWFNSIQQKLQALEFSNDSLINGNGYWTWARSTENDTTVDIDPSHQSVRAVVTYKFK